MRKLAENVVVVTTRTHSLELTAEDIITLFRKAGCDIPRGAKVEFKVPGGGDWSNTLIEVDNNSPVIVTWETTD